LNGVLKEVHIVNDRLDIVLLQVGTHPIKRSTGCDSDSEKRGLAEYQRLHLSKFAIAA
jgi:hypothetical protein